MFDFSIVTHWIDNLLRSECPVGELYLLNLYW